MASSGTLGEAALFTGTLPVLVNSHTRMWKDASEVKPGRSA
ncbi:hypothetical protein [Cellulomonas sp.]|nr:hypothetical protein [Cellulomonas sp.]